CQGRTAVLRLRSGLFLLLRSLLLSRFLCFKSLLLRKQIPFPLIERFPRPHHLPRAQQHEAGDPSSRQQDDQHPQQQPHDPSGIGIRPVFFVLAHRSPPKALEHACVTRGILSAPRRENLSESGALSPRGCLGPLCAVNPRATSRPRSPSAQPTA